MKIKENEKIKKEIPNLVMSFIVSIIVTIITYFRFFTNDEYYSIFDVSKLNWWGFAGILGSIFLFTFGLTMSLLYWNKIKGKLSEITNYTLFLILSVFLSSIVTFFQYDTFTSIGEMLLSFALATGSCFAIFTIFYRFDYKKIKICFVQFVKSLAYGVLFPSMFLIIALMGKIDSEGKFMSRTIPSLTNAGNKIGEGFIKLIEYIYNLGKYEYSGFFMITIFIFLIFFSLHNFFKKTKEELKELENENQTDTDERRLRMK